MLVLNFIYKNVVSFRDLFFIKLKSRYPSFNKETLNKDSLHCILILISGYYVSVIISVFIFLHKFSLVSKDISKYEFLAKIIFGIVILGPIFLFRNYLFSKFMAIPVDENRDINNQNNIIKRLIFVFIIGYASIYFFASATTYILSFF